MIGGPPERTASATLRIAGQSISGLAKSPHAKFAPAFGWSATDFVISTASFRLFSFVDVFVNAARKDVTSVCVVRDVALSENAHLVWVCPASGPFLRLPLLGNDGIYDPCERDHTPMENINAKIS